MDDGGGKVTHRFHIVADRTGHNVCAFVGRSLREDGYLPARDATQTSVRNVDLILFYSDNTDQSLHSFGGVGWPNDP